jgi:hypothetical protein
MTESQEKKEEGSVARNGNWQEEVFTKIVRAGTRTYYFDVKTVRDNSSYLTITESKRKIDSSGNPFYLKHKIFLYNEDIEKFLDGLNEAITHVKEESTDAGVPEKDTTVQDNGKVTGENFTEVKFEDLDDK